FTVRILQSTLVPYTTLFRSELWFENGRVVKSKARKNEKVLKAMIATKDADKVGEFSLTDSRFSRITKFMAETLFDENVGGPQGKDRKSTRLNSSHVKISYAV